MLSGLTPFHSISRGFVLSSPKLSLADTDNDLLCFSNCAKMTARLWRLRIESNVKVGDSVLMQDTRFSSVFAPKYNIECASTLMVNFHMRCDYVLKPSVTYFVPMRKEGISLVKT